MLFRSVDADGAAALGGNPEGIMMLSKAIDHLSKAQKNTADFAEKIEKAAEARTKREAAATVDAIGKETGITARPVACPIRYWPTVNSPVCMAARKSGRSDRLS